MWYDLAMYTTSRIATLFQISHQTVKNYSQEFAAYLSPTATPSENRARRFTDTDLKVIALAVDLKRQGATYEDIHAALKMGQRGAVPEVSTELSAPATAIVHLQQQIADLQTQLRHSEESRQQQAGQIALLKEQLADAQKEIRRLERETAHHD